MDGSGVRARDRRPRWALRGARRVLPGGVPQEALSNASQIIQIARDPQFISGVSAKPELFFSALAAKFNLTGPDAAAKTQAMLGLFAKNTLAASKDLKGSISEKEYPFLEAASSGSITWTPEALQHLAALATAANHNKLLNGLEQWEGAAGKNPRAQQMWPLPPISHTLPEGLDFKEGPRGRISYQGILQNPNLVKTPTAPGAPTGPSKIDPNKVYTLDELRQMGLLK